MMALLILTLGLTMVILILWLLFKQSFNYWKKKGVYFLEPIIPFGNALNIIRQKESLGTEMKNFYNHLKKKSLRFGGYYFLTRPVFVPIDLDLIKRMSSTDFEHFTDHTFSYQEHDPLTSHIYALKGQAWKNLRNKLSPAFTSSKNKMMFSTVTNCVEVLVEILNELSTRIETVDIHDVITRLSIDVISSCAFGIDCNSLKNPNSELKTNVLKYFEPSTRNILVFLAATLAPKILKIFRIRTVSKQLTDFFINLTKETVNYRETNKIVRKDFIHLLLQIRNNAQISENEVGVFKTSGETSLTIEQLAAQSLVFFVGGFETSCSVLTFCLYELSLNQDIQDNARNELLNALDDNNGEYTYELVHKLPYLDKCVYETLRKHPVAPIHLRECTKDYTIPNSQVHLKKGTYVCIPTLGVHRDPEYYPNPEKFDPERFSQENVQSRNSYAFIPFGLGPRICIAYSFGLMEIKVVLAMLLTKFKFTLNSKTKQPLGINPKSMLLLPINEVWLNVEKI